MDLQIQKLKCVNSVNFDTNEVTLNIDDKLIKLCANFTNLSNVQRMTGLGEMKNIDRLADSSIGVRDIAVILFYLIKDDDPRIPDVDTLGQMIVDSGIFREVALVTMQILYFPLMSKKKPIANKRKK